ncbi:MAG: hypothetical protein DMF68_08250 [Acidobacteria bacterium]|nr:MAG: hypothetical protein DMF68_08250 [Acidobacteriota bacterium]
MSTWRRAEVTGGACGLEDRSGANEAMDDAGDFETSAEIRALKSRLDCSTEATAATAFAGRFG